MVPAAPEKPEKPKTPETPEKRASAGAEPPSEAEASAADTLPQDSALALPAECDEWLYSYWWRVYARTQSTALDSSQLEPGAWTRRRRLFEYTGCADGCPDEWIDDGTCDAACHVPECDFDGRDCFHNAGECYALPDGTDYRGKVAETRSGRECQAWSAQTPNHHTYSVLNYPNGGLGGHNYCRNPAPSESGFSGPWCFTTDFPNLRAEACDVGQPAKSCNASHPSHAMPGGAAAPLARVSEGTKKLSLGVFVDGQAAELEQIYFELHVPVGVPGLKVVLLPITGDCDLFLSFSQPRPSRLNAQWVEEAVGVKQWVIARTNPHFCAGAVGDACVLYLTVAGFEEGDFKLVVYNYTSDAVAGGGAPGSSSVAWSCSVGCDELRLGNTQCDPACNTSACAWDQVGCYARGALSCTRCTRLHARARARRARSLSPSCYLMGWEGGAAI